MKPPAAFGSAAITTALQNLRKGIYPLPPSFSNTFRVTRFLGAGTFGDVFEAHKLPSATSDSVPERIAVKLIPKDATDGGLSFEIDYAPALTDATRDPRAKRLRRYLDLNWSDDNFYYVSMEYLGDTVTSLEDALSGTESVGFVDARTWLGQILEGLEFLHSRRAEHGDIHARNILLVGEKDKVGAKEAIINDFGEARIVELGDGVPGAIDVADFLRMAAKISTRISERQKSSEEGRQIADSDRKLELKAQAAIRAMLMRSVAPGRKKGALPSAADLRKMLELGSDSQARL